MWTIFQVSCSSSSWIYWVIIIMCSVIGIMTMLLLLLAYLSTSDPMVVYLYGQDIILLATDSESDIQSIDFKRIDYEILERSQIDIYIGNPNVYNESIFKQGNVQPQSSVLVNREYLTPNSTLTVQFQPDNVNETNFIAIIEIKNGLNGTYNMYAETIVTSPSNYTWTFNESDYYTIWIKSSVQLNYTITGEVYRYNASDLTLGCSILKFRYSCSLTPHTLNGLDTNELYIFGIATRRDTITKLSYTTVDNALETGVLIVSVVNVVLLVIILATLIRWLCKNIYIS